MNRPGSVIMHPLSRLLAMFPVPCLSLPFPALPCPVCPALPCPTFRCRMSGMNHSGSMIICGQAFNVSSNLSGVAFLMLNTASEVQPVPSVGMAS